MMIPALLYLITGLLTGYPLAFTGAFKLSVPLIGAVVMLLAGIVGWFKPHTAGRLALAGSIALWVYYGPLLVGVLQLATSSRSVAIDWGAQLPAFFLVLTSFVSLFYATA